MFLKQPVFHFGSTKCRWFLREYWTLLATCNPSCWGLRLKPCHKCPCNMKWWLEYQLFIILVWKISTYPQFFLFSLCFFGLCEYILIHWEGIESLYFLEILHYGSEKRERIGKIWHTIIILWHVFNLKCTRVYRRSLNMSVVSCVSR